MISIIAMISTTSAQYGDRSTVLEPNRDLTIYQDLGIFAGVGANNQSGKFYGGCNCEFDKGAAAGFTLGALYERVALAPWLRFGLGLGVDFLGLDNTTQNQENIPVTSQATGLTEYVLADVEHTATTRLAFFNISPYVKYTFKHWFFVRMGLTYSLLVQNSFTHDKELKTTKARLSNNEMVDLRFTENQDTKLTLVDGDFPGAKSILYFEPAIGFNIRFSNKILMSPILQYGLPLGGVSDTYQDFKINKLRFMLELRYNLIEED
jgi:hypothetical protein